MEVYGFFWIFLCVLSILIFLFSIIAIANKKNFFSKFIRCGIALELAGILLFCQIIVAIFIFFEFSPWGVGDIVFTLTPLAFGVAVFSVSAGLCIFRQSKKI